MATKPILFNTEMVRAIMDGRKVVTRRPLKQPFEMHPNGYITKPKGNERLCPYEPPYQKGDYLYVRETWARVQGNSCIANISGTCPYESCENAAGPCFPEEYIYKATDILPLGEKWKPSIHMPKEAARIFLQVKDVKVERLCEISGEELLKEGIDKKILFNGPVSKAFNKFIEIWNSTIKPEDIHKYGWDANPYVWVIEFEKAEVVR